MSLINNIDFYEQYIKTKSLSTLVSQSSGILMVDYQGNIKSSTQYFVDDGAVRFNVVETTATGPIIASKTHRAWALPGTLIETLRGGRINPVIQLPTLPYGAVLTKNADVLLVTTIPYYWYPQVPNGDRLDSYQLRFDVPFLDTKNNRQYFKVAQHDILEEGVIIIQLSSIPAFDINVSSSSTQTLDIVF